MEDVVNFLSLIFYITLACVFAFLLEKAKKLLTTLTRQTRVTWDDRLVASIFTGLWFVFFIFFGVNIVSALITALE